MTGADWLVRGERRDFLNGVRSSSGMKTVTLMYIQNFFQNTN